MVLKFDLNKYIKTDIAPRFSCLFLNSHKKNKRYEKH